MNKKENNYSRLNLIEIQAIFVMRKQKLSFQSIADKLHRSKSTVWEVVKLHQHPFPSVWLDMSPYEKARHVYEDMQKNHKRQGNHGHVKNVEARRFICQGLLDGHSPEEVSAMMNREMPEKRVCAKTIYNFVKYERKEFREYLIEKGKPRRQEVTKRKQHKKESIKKPSIHERPKEANERLELGHFEADLLLSKKGIKDCLLVLTERVTRKSWIRPLPNRESSIVQGVLRAVLSVIPKHLLKSITFDNGSEFAVAKMLKLEKFFPGLKIYYCDPYCSWQKGSVENTNKRIRQHIPKGSDLSQISKNTIAEVNKKINKKLLKCLNWYTPDELWDFYVNPEYLLPLAA